MHEIFKIFLLGNNLIYEPLRMEFIPAFYKGLCLARRTFPEATPHVVTDDEFSEQDRSLKNDD
jgi:hypothetical protein